MPFRLPARLAAGTAALLVGVAPAALRAQAAVSAAVDSTPLAVAAATPAVAPVPDSATAPVEVAPAPARTAGPTLDGARVGAHRATTVNTTVAAPVSGPHAGQPVALMVVGGAGLIAGAIIGGKGGTVIAVSGAVIGLIGLYEFIR